MSEPLCRLAQEMGITVITTETKPSDETEKLCAQYGVKMALHNHPNSWPPDQVLDACKGRGAAVGACADTGHWMRRGLNPVATLKQLEGRIVCVHLKDLNEFGGVAGAKPHDVPWGTGKGDARAMLAELHRQGFKGMIAIEYEHITPDLMADLAKCIAFFDQVAAELTAQTPPDPKPGQ
jgi:sugar phosphate isomerase/epimerase